MASDSDSTASCEDKVYSCKWHNPVTNQLCNATFTRSSSLKRHELRFHQDSLSTTFVHLTPGSRARRTVHVSKRSSPSNTARSTPLPTSAFDLSTSLGPRTPSPASVSSTTSPPYASGLLSASALPFSGVTRGPFSIAGSNEAPATIGPPRSRPFWNEHECGSATDSDVEARRHPLTLPTAPLSQNFPRYTALSLSNRARTIPHYGPRLSKRSPGQPKGLDWLTQDAKAKFFTMYESLLAKWGRTTRHQGTCLLVPQDWIHSEPLDLMALFSIDNLPTAASRRAVYSHADHGVALARAKVWFDLVQRRGVDLDALLESHRSLRPMDASHLCHHEHCVIHLVYEPANVNQDRHECCSQAKFLRSERRMVPEHCTLHDPPCMMQVSEEQILLSIWKKAKIEQHAALTPLEIYYHQFAELSQANGLPPPVAPTRPWRYPYPTFESSLPCQFPSVAVRQADLVSKPPTGRLSHRPDLMCRYCVGSNLKTFASIIGFWSHIVNKHQGVDNLVRLQKIQESAAQWLRYWELHSYGGKRDNPTLAKVLQTQGEGFCWSDVLDWSLRWG